MTDQSRRKPEKFNQKQYGKIEITNQPQKRPILNLTKKQTLMIGAGATAIGIAGGQFFGILGFVGGFVLAWTLPSFLKDRKQRQLDRLLEEKKQGKF